MQWSNLLSPSSRQRNAVLRLAFFGKVILSAGLIGWIVARASPHQIVAALKEAQFSWLTLAACLPAIGTLLTVVRWGLLLRAQGAHIPTTTLYQSCMVAGFFGQFLPSTIAGDAVRVLDTWKGGTLKSIAISAVLVDRLIGLFVLVLFGVVAICSPNNLAMRLSAIQIWLGIVATSFLLCSWLVVAPPRGLSALVRKFSEALPTRARMFIDRVIASLKIYRSNRRVLAWAFLLSILLQINVVTFYYTIGLSLGIKVSYGFYYLIVPIAVLVMLVPISINGIGVRESIFTFLLGMLAVETASAVAFAWIEYGIVLLYGVLGGVVYALRKRNFGNTEAVHADSALFEYPVGISRYNQSDGRN